MGLSRRAYAKHRGVSEGAVRHAIKAERIALEPDGTIDPVKADASWKAHSDPAKKRDTAKKSVPATALESVRETLREHGDAVPTGGMTYLQARTANEVLKAQERRLKLQQLKGELIDRSKAAAHVFALARQERDVWVQWPARVAAVMAADLGLEAHTVQAALETHVTSHLGELAKIRIDLKP